MNEQLIKKFTSRCGIEYDSDDGADDESLRKYTELIVRECIEVIDSRNRKQFHPTSTCGELLYNVAKDVKQHFGVE